MHRCLHIPDIINLICDQVDGTHQKRKSTLFALARSCQLFREPALAGLWQSIRYISPIIKCAGKDLWKEDHENVLQLSRPISPPDIVIMKKYAHLVRSYEQRLPELVQIDVWQALHHAFGGTVLFPNLRSVQFSHRTILQFAALFGTDHLTTFKVYVDALPHLSMVLDFSARCPSLTSVDLGWPFDKPEAPQWVIPALSNWHNLSQVVLSVGTPEILQALLSRSASLRDLRLIKMNTPKNISQQLSPPTGADVPVLPALEAINIGFGQFSDAIRFFNSFPATSNLQSLLLDFNDETTHEEKDWLQLLQSVKKFAHSLKELSIAEGLFRRSPEFRILSNALCFILATDFSKLTHVNILKRAGGYDIDDSDIKQLTKALPALENFSLDARAGDIRFGPTIACLVFFACNCLSLSRLALQFDARTEKIPQQAETSSQPPKLEWLEVSISPIDHPEPVAKFLFETFSNLRLLSRNDYWDSRYGGPWLEVSRLLTEYRRTAGEDGA